MKFGHLFFPALFLLVLAGGAYWIVRSVDDVSYASPNQPVYLESGGKFPEVTAESVEAMREKAYQAFNRFADSLVEEEALSLEEKEHFNQILQLGEGHWGEENWAPAFYAFERVLNELTPLIGEGLGDKRANEMEARYREVSRSLTNEIAFAESTYMEAFETANLGYNALQEKDWISAIQLFARAIDSLNLVKAQAAEIVSQKLKAAYAALEAGDTQLSKELFNEVLVVYPEMEAAINGLQLIHSEVVKEEIPEVLEVPEVEVSAEVLPVPNTILQAPEEIELDLELSENPLFAAADEHFNKREFKESLLMYLELRASNPEVEGLEDRIRRSRLALRNEETIRMMDKASILADLGQWVGVIKTYRQILNVQPMHKEARLGWEEALVKLVELKQIEQFKNLIRHHLNARQFSHAKEVFAAARNVLYDVADFDELFLPLRLELQEQQVPITLRLESDGETWVSIPGKFAPEQFRTKEITSFPGRLALVGWRNGFEHVSVSLAFGVADAPESITIICDTKRETEAYWGSPGKDRVLEALAAFDIANLLTDVDAFTTWFRMGGKMDGILSNEKELEEWNRALFSKVYAALSQQSDQTHDLIHLEARGQFIEVPENLTRKETLELGQYFVSRE